MRIIKSLMIIILVVMVSCELTPLDDYQLPSYDGEFVWTEMVRNAEWSNRLDHAAAVFKDMLWISGGYSPGELKNDPYLEDVWSSHDGIQWEKACDNAPWKGRRGHTMLSFDDGSGEALYIIGGFSVDESTGHRQYCNDVWKSFDGINWELVKERTYPSLTSTDDWFPRMGHVCLKVPTDSMSQLYIIGGCSMMEKVSARYAMEYFNDVWRSTDAVHWEKLPANEFGIRSGHAGSVDPANGKMYIQGGVHGVIFENQGETKDHPIDQWDWLWTSTDGISWTPENDTLNMDQGMLGRTEHQMIFFKNALWGLPGSTTSNNHFHFVREKYYASWKYTEPSTWNIDSKGCAIDARYSYPSVIFEDKIWIFGGHTNMQGPANDVWCGQLN